MTGVYAFENRVNGKVYVGSAFNLGDRLGKHLSDLRNRTHHSAHLQNAWEKYGPGAFEWKVLEIVEDKDALLEAEQGWIDHYDAANPDHGYNICPVAGSPAGRPVSEETREKIRQAATNISDETRRRRSVALMGNSNSAGRELSEEHRQKLSEAMRGNDNRLGQTNSEEHNKAISEALTGKEYGPHSEEHKQKIAEGVKKARARMKKEGRKLPKQSEETRRKRAEAMKRYWARKRANG